MAEPADVPQILRFIRKLATFERMENEVEATEDILRKNLFERKSAEVIIAEWLGKAVGFVLFFHNFSTFLGKPGIYIEDLFVKEEFRGKGIGKILLKRIAQLAVERECGRVEWWVLKWNPALEFYRRMGAESMDEWVVCRLDGDQLIDAAT
jgi:GNAT superfamily N-acetyltransferase